MERTKSFRNEYLRKKFEENYLKIMPSFFEMQSTFLSGIYNQGNYGNSLYTGVRVYQPSRKPLLQAFTLSSGAKLIILTGMHKSGFSLAEIYAEKALSLI